MTIVFKGDSNILLRLEDILEQDVREAYAYFFTGQDDYVINYILLCVNATHHYIRV